MVLNTVAVKEQILRDLLSSIIKRSSEFEQLLVETRGQPREYKVRKALALTSSSESSDVQVRNVLGQFSQRLLRYYRDLTQENLDGALLSFLSYLKKANVKMTCFSASPCAELSVLISRLGLRNFFDEIGGAPIEKKILLEEYIKKNNIEPAETIYIGDTLRDLSIAQSVGVSFIGCDVFDPVVDWPIDVTVIGTWQDMEKIFPIS